MGSAEIMAPGGKSSGTRGGTGYSFLFRLSGSVAYFVSSFFVGTFPSGTRPAVTIHLSNV